MHWTHLFHSWHLFLDWGSAYDFYYQTMNIKNLKVWSILPYPYDCRFPGSKRRTQTSGGSTAKTYCIDMMIIPISKLLLILNMRITLSNRVLIWTSQLFLDYILSHLKNYSLPWLPRIAIGLIPCLQTPVNLELT